MKTEPRGWRYAVDQLTAVSPKCIRAVRSVNRYTPILQISKLRGSDGRLGAIE
jgi:hypothetical protein